MSAADDERFMRAAIALAQRGWGRTHPNPMVGCAIVEGGEIVAGAFHEQDGGPHAERAALDSLGRKPRAGATLYVTLEPCSTEGRTGACTRAIIAAGVKRVVVGATDPNPEHAGRGYDILRQSGVEVRSGVLEADCADLNLIFNHWITRKEPLLTGKLAATLDGKIATRTGESRWITGDAARADVHRWRRLFPAIAVGAGTVITDNPSLTARMPDEPESCPVRFVFDGRLRSISSASLPKVYADGFAKRTIVVTTQHAGVGYVRKLRDLGVGVWVFESPSGKVPLSQFRSKCAAEGIVGVLLEGGAELLSRALIERQLDYLLAYRAPIVFADERAKSVLAGLRTEKLSQAIRLTDVRHQALGDDSLMRGNVTYPLKVQIDETLFSLG
jgi:diaminohydroxyphosphoribosylaminopyrimidine deaminase / 5-amino-6-(5-phosphoribosylamino)uracil reductase